MSNLYWLTDAQMARLKPFFPKSHGKPRVDDRRDVSQGTPHGIEPAGQKGGRARQIGRTKGGMNTKLHAVADAKGRPIGFFMSAGQVSDYIGAAALLGRHSHLQRRLRYRRKTCHRSVSATSGPLFWVYLRPNFHLPAATSPTCHSSCHDRARSVGLCFRSLSRTEGLLPSNSGAIQSTIRLMRVWPR